MPQSDEISFPNQQYSCLYFRSRRLIRHRKYRQQSVHDTSRMSTLEDLELCQIVDRSMINLVLRPHVINCYPTDTGYLRYRLGANTLTLLLPTESVLCTMIILIVRLLPHPFYNNVSEKPKTMASTAQIICKYLTYIRLVSFSLLFCFG